MLSFKGRRAVSLILSVVMLFSTIMLFDDQSVSAAQKGDGWQGSRVSVGEMHSLALKADGTVIAWGRDVEGQATVPAGLSGVRSISAGWKHSLALRTNGTVAVWGDNSAGQLNIPPGLNDVKAISGGGAHSLALKADGTVVAWGSDAQGQATVPTNLGNVVAISAGRAHSLALKANGTVVAWGNDAGGQATVPINLRDVVAISAGTFHSYALHSNGTITEWGLNNGNPSNMPANLENITAISAGDTYSLALRADGTVIGWGDNMNSISNIPTDAGIVSISAGANHALALKADGTIIAWGDNDESQTTVPAGFDLPVKGSLLAGGLLHSTALKSDGTAAGWGFNLDGQGAAPAGLNHAVAVASGEYHSIALKADGTVFAWGQSIPAHGNQGNIPAGLSGVTAISTRWHYSLALKSDGTVASWGSKGQGTVPVGLKEVVAIAAGQDHSLALKSNGTVVAWGGNIRGQSDVPDDLTDVVAIAAGAEFSLALKANGTVVAWGHNIYGQLNVPGGLNGVIAIAAGEIHTLALKADGTVVAWGNSTVNRLDIPSGMNGVVAIAAGRDQSLALKSDGNIVAWGGNGNGQLNVPGNAGLSGLTLLEGDFTEIFNSSVTAYKFYYDGQSLSSVNITPTLASTRQTVMYVNDELLASGSTKTINIAGATTNTIIPVRVEPYLLPSQTYTVTLEIDSTPPSVQFEINGQTTAAQTAATKVTVSDTQSGVASQEYVWSQTATAPTTGWSAFSNADTLSQTSGDGNWYLHIRATDEVGNAGPVASRLFVLDNTAPTATVSSSVSGGINVPFEVTISFNEAVNGFTVNDLTINNGTASGFVVVSPQVYTALITPTTSGELVTVTVSAAAATDTAGNGNTASNTLSVLYDITKPAVTFGGFMDGQQFAASPAEVSVTISELVHWVAGDVALTAINALPLISMTKDGGGFSAYTPSYDESSRTFTLSFDDPLHDGVYEVHVAGGVVKNVNHNTLDAVDAAFSVAVPVVAGISASSTTLPTTGGSAVVTLTGVNLTGQILKIYVDGVEAATATVSNGTSAEAAVTLPANMTYTAKDHHLTVFLNGVEVIGQETVITVIPLPYTPPTLSGDSTLTELNLQTPVGAPGLSPVFAPETTTYTAETTEEQVELQLDPANSKATITVQGERIGDKAVIVPLAPGSNELTITVQAEDGTVTTYTVTINRITPSARVCSFKDIAGHWAENEICEAADLGIVTGVSADLFLPNVHVTRAEFAIMLLRTLKIDTVSEAGALPFSDQGSISGWARLAVQTAVDKEILRGYPDRTLKPNQTIDRAEMAALVSRVMNWQPNSNKRAPFADEAIIPGWAKADVKAAHEYGIIVGRSGNQFAPASVTTRAEAAVVLLRLWKIIQ